MEDPAFRFPLHRAVIMNDMREVARLLDEQPDEEKRKASLDERDARGVPPMHYAIHMSNRPMVKLLLDRGADCTRKSAGGWSTMQEAIASSNRVIAKDLLVAIQLKISTEYEKRLPALVGIVEKIPDFYMELKWEFHSWVPLVSRLCPSDTYRIWKRGASFRVDTTLVGFEGTKWVRGDLSYIFLGEQGGEVIILDHKKKTIERAFSSSSLKSGNAGNMTDAEIRKMMSPVLTKTTALTENVVFNASKTWLGYEKTEKVGDDEWKAKVFDFEGFDLRIVSRKKIKRKGEASAATSADKLRQDLLEKCDVEPSESHQGLFYPNEETSEKNKSYKGTIWLSEEFPRTVEELIPIFETLAPTQKHFKKLNEFISMQMPADGFPVKLDIPVFPTVTASVTFLTHQETEIEIEKFEIPAEYVPVDPANKRATVAAKKGGPKMPGEDGEEVVAAAGAEDGEEVVGKRRRSVRVATSSDDIEDSSNGSRHREEEGEEGEEEEEEYEDEEGEDKDEEGEEGEDEKDV